MDYLQRVIGKDMFNIVLQFYDPVREKQVENKRILFWVFKMAEAIPHCRVPCLSDCEKWFLKYKDFNTTYRGSYNEFCRNIWNQRDRYYFPHEYSEARITVVKFRNN
jgi:hypothetical protein